MTDELLQDILEQTRKEARFSKMIALIMLAILILLIIVMFMLVPRALSMMAEIEKTAQDAQAVIETAQTTIGELRSMAGDLRTTMSGVGEMTESITKTGNALFDGISKVDFDALSKAVTDLEEAVKPLANLSRVLSGR